MTRDAAWLDLRRPHAPDALEAAVRGWLELERVGPLPSRLAAAGRRVLAEARARPGRVRESAFDLLAADALVTYACEAALEGPDPSAVLASLLEIGKA